MLLWEDFKYKIQIRWLRLLTQGAVCLLFSAESVGALCERLGYPIDPSKADSKYSDGSISVADLAEDVEDRRDWARLSTPEEAEGVVERLVAELLGFDLYSNKEQ